MQLKQHEINTVYQGELQKEQMKIQGDMALERLEQEGDKELKTMDIMGKLEVEQLKQKGDKWKKSPQFPK